MGSGLSIFKNGQGDVRAGWVALAFAVVFIAMEVVASFLTEFLSISFSSADQSDPALITITLSTFVSAMAATATCVVAFKADVGWRSRTSTRAFAIGFSCGIALLVCTIALQTFSGHATLSRADLSFPRMLGFGVEHLFVIGLTSVAEEFLMRGVAFRALLKVAPSWVVISVSGLIFGAVHLMNPHATWSAAAIITLVGIWFGMLVLKCGSLTAGIGVHLSWNFAEGFIFGHPVSGIAPGKSVFTATWDHDVSFFSGGDFGPEASGITLVLLLVAIGVTAVFPGPASSSD